MAAEKKIYIAIWMKLGVSISQWRPLLIFHPKCFHRVFRRAITHMMLGLIQSQGFGLSKE